MIRRHLDCPGVRGMHSAECGVGGRRCTPGADSGVCELCGVDAPAGADLCTTHQAEFQRVGHQASEYANVGGGYLCACGAPVPCRASGASLGRASESVRDLLGPRVMGVGAYGQAVVDGERERLHGLLVEAYRRGEWAAGGEGRG